MNHGRLRGEGEATGDRDGTGEADGRGEGEASGNKAVVRVMAQSGAPLSLTLTHPRNLERGDACTRGLCVYVFFCSWLYGTQWSTFT
jgi:hypothetical protein